MFAEHRALANRSCTFPITPLPHPPTTHPHFKASQKILTHLDAQEAHALTRLHHPEAAAIPNAGSDGAAAEEEDEAAAVVVDMSTTFEDDDEDYKEGFGLFVNNTLFSDVSLRLSDDRSFAGHR